MAYIYKITNKTNQKSYIGKTTRTPQERFEEHRKEAKRERAKDRPFYKAINKYGMDNFTLETIEECSDEIASEREQFWIQAYATFKYGYNATIGGDGKPYIDYNLVVALYKQFKNQKKVAEIMDIHVDSVHKILDKMEIIKKHDYSINTIIHGKAVKQIDKNTNEIIRVYDSTRLAEKALGIKNSNTHIGEVCRGKRKTAYGYKWEYVEY